MSNPPTSVLDRLVQQRVVLQLKDGRQLSGRLVGSDEHLNLVLEETEERAAEVTRRLGRVVLRGSNIVSLNAPAGAPTKAP